MFLKHKLTHNLVEVLTLPELWDPCIASVTGRFHAGEELQDPEVFLKTDLMFPSEERLPRCWLDAHYLDSLSSAAGHPDLLANDPAVLLR